MSEAIDFYRDKKILITGAAGFLGKLLMEKLLRLCDVGKIYMLIRDKKGMIAEQRIDNIFHVPVFERMRQLKPDFLNCIQIIRGDVSLPGLGLSEDTKSFLMEEIDIVFHVAATVNFGAPIKRATSVNVCGTKEIALLCQKMKHLKAFVFVSTAYSNCLNKEISERFYDPPLRADELIDLCEHLSDEDLSIAMKKYMECWPNTYAFTKCVAEDVIKTYAAGIPTCVVRPAIVICTKSEPIEGWVDNFYGPGGYIAGVAAGVIRVGRMDSKATIALVPADMCINVMMAACYHTAKSGFKQEATIYNVTSAALNQLTNGKFVDYVLKACRRTPSVKMIWKPRLMIVKATVLYSSLSFVYHLLPALLIDSISAIFFKRANALKSYRDSERFINALSFFTCREWTFSENNLRSLWNQLNPADKALMDFDVNQLDWEEMIALKVRGIRKHLLKDHEGTIPMAKKKLYWLNGADWILQAFIILLMGIFFVKYISSIPA